METSDTPELDKEYYSSIQPVYYTFRFTFTEQSAETEPTKQDIARFKAISRNLKTKILETYTVQKMTGGLETLNKNGDRTFAHLHLHFDALENKDSMIRTIKRYLQDTYDQNTTGVKAFSFKPKVIRTFDEYWRYPLKFNLDTTLCKGFTNEQLETFHEIAKASINKVIEVNQSKLDKSDNSDTLFQRLKNIWDKEMIQEKVPLLVRASKFYVEENKPINRNTIIGYVENYMLLKGYLTHESYWGERL